MRPGGSAALAAGCSTAALVGLACALAWRDGSALVPLDGGVGRQGSAWPFLALAYVVSGWRGLSPRRAALGGAAAVFVSVMALEWAQCFLPGRSADITDALVATGAWLLGWRLLSDSGYASDPRPDPEDRSPSRAEDSRHRHARR